jgi:hypothetical protein
MIAVFGMFTGHMYVRWVSQYTKAVACTNICYRSIYSLNGDQLGLTARHSRHLYANPGNPIASTMFAFGLYFLLFGVPLQPTWKLFPGWNQYKRFGRLLKAILEEHIDEVSAFGFELSDIGAHGIRKGATTYLSSQPGGPAPDLSVSEPGGPWVA